MAKKNERKLERSGRKITERNVHSSNSIDKSLKSQKIIGKVLRKNATKEYAENFIENELERLKGRRNSTEKLQRLDMKYTSSVGNDYQKGKLRIDENFNNRTSNKSIDKIGRLSLATKSSKLNYQNLKMPSVELPEHHHSPTMPSNASNQYNYEVFPMINFKSTFNFNLLQIHFEYFILI